MNTKHLHKTEFITAIPVSSNNTADSVALFTRPPTAPWKDDALDKLRKFQSYQDDWDEEGAKAFSESCITQALEFLRLLVHKPNFPKPNIVVGYHGDIVFYWARNGQELQISVLPEGVFWVSSRASGAKFSGPETSQKMKITEVWEQFDLLSLKIQ